MHPHSAPGVTRAQRQELAAAVLWFHTHVIDPVPALDRLSFESQEPLAECFVQDLVVYMSDANWRRVQTAPGGWASGGLWRFRPAGVGSGAG